MMISLDRVRSIVEVFLISSLNANVTTSIATSIDFFHEALLCFHSVVAR